MKSVKIQKLNQLISGVLNFPGDKSLSHRAIIFGSLAEGKSHFTNVLNGEDCVCTRKAFESMGVRIDDSKGGTEMTIHGVGLHGLKAPKSDIYCGNSGTLMRLLMGVLAGQGFSATLTGDPSLSSRPMKRVGDWLKQMGAKVEGREDGNFAPLKITGGKLKAIDAKLPMASAQVKSAILLAGLYAEGETKVSEPEKSRDHTERFLIHYGGKIEIKGTQVILEPVPKLQAQPSFPVAGDISSAAFFMAAAALLKNPNITFQSVLWNKTRTGICEVMNRAGVEVSTHIDKMSGPEWRADFNLRAGDLKPFEIQKSELPSLIDEIPILCVLATQASGTSVIHDADELRVKESDRIEAIKNLLNPMGAKISSKGNTIVIEGPTKLEGAVVDSKKDHRIAMSGIIAGLIAEGETTVRDIECIDTSFPTFFALLRELKVPFQMV